MTDKNLDRLINAVCALSVVLTGATILLTGAILFAKELGR